jgi:glutamate N-acetyltransferase/amino-acid N-acetyltransferase
VNLPHGYRYSALYAGIRKVNKPDLALLVSDTPASAAAVFTTNLVQAAPVRLCKKHLKESRGKARAILVNAGNANCATRTGDKVALATSRATAQILGCPVSHVLPSSTGVIGVELDSKLITEALPKLVETLAPERFLDVAEAILTTDTVRKVATTRVGDIRIAGMTKGSGMIHPNMATTLAFVLTDAVASPAQLSGILRTAVERSYNRLSVDGDMSTNDTLALLANGASGVKLAGRGLREFEMAVGDVCELLASQIARDGEGAKKRVLVEVSGARNKDDAARIARAIANSPLVKTAIAGADPNWGRVLSAAGYSGARFDPSAVNIKMQGITVCRRGLAAAFNEAELQEKLKGLEVYVRFEIAGSGKASTRFWTCDLTEGYIEINGSYRT